MKICGFVGSTTALYSLLFEDPQSLTGRPSRSWQGRPPHPTTPAPSHPQHGHPEFFMALRTCQGSAHLLSGSLLPSPSYFFSFCNSQLKPKNPPGRLPSLSLFWKFPWQAVSYAQHPFVIPCGHNQIVPLTFPLLIYFLSIHFSPGIPETMWKLGWLWSAYLLSMMCNQ